MTTVKPRDFYPPRDDMPWRPPNSTDPRKFHARGWVPSTIDVEDEFGGRYVELDTARSIGVQLEAAGFDPHEAEEIHDEIITWFSPPRISVKLYKQSLAGAVTNFELHEVVDLVGDVLERQNRPPYVFRRMHTLVRLDIDEHDRPTFTELNSAGLQTELSRMAQWTQKKTMQKGLVDVVVDPPAKHTGIVLRDPPRRVPVAVGLVQTPVLRPDGSLLDVEGYDEATRLLYRRPWGMNPTRYSTVAEALEVIREMVQDFPFDGLAGHERWSSPSFANYLAWILTPSLRSIIGLAPTPVALFDAPAPRTGKDQLAGTASLIYDGVAPAERPLPADDEEIRKELVAAMISGRPLMLYTNVSGILRSDPLAGFVTSAHWSGRRLGHSEDVSFENKMVIGITANNLGLSSDWPGRIYRISIDARRPDPENRSFAIHDLPSWVMAHRNDQLGAILSLARLWARDTGCAVDEVQWSSYSRWASVVGSVLKYSGVEGFLANTASNPNDPAEEVWWGLISRWYERFGSGWKTTKELEELSSDADDWPSELLTTNGGMPGNLGQRLGTHLRQRLGSMTPDGYRVERLADLRPAKWRIVK